MRTFQLSKLDTFEKCCNYINIDPNLPDVSMIAEQHATAVQNNYALMVICEAWNKADNFIPDYGNPNQIKWFPVFEYNRKTGSFSFVSSDCYSSTAYLGTGSRLCFKTEERADQFGKQFIDLHNSILLIDTPAKNLEKVLVNNIKDQYIDYVKENSDLPQYAHCEISFKEDPKTEDVIIKMTSDVNENEDESIFYKCDSLNDLLSLCNEGSQDFKIVGFIKFD